MNKKLRKELDELHLGLLDFSNDLITFKTEVLGLFVELKTLKIIMSSIGECYTKSSSWKKFQKEDIQETHDNYIKIFDTWFDKKDVIFYNPTQKFDKKKKEIEERINKKEDK